MRSGETRLWECEREFETGLVVFSVRSCKDETGLVSALLVAAPLGYQVDGACEDVCFFDSGL